MSGVVGKGERKSWIRRRFNPSLSLCICIVFHSVFASKKKGRERERERGEGNRVGSNERLFFLHLPSCALPPPFLHFSVPPQGGTNPFIYLDQSEPYLDQFQLGRREIERDGAMAISYSMVARGQVVLAEFQGSPANASTAARQVLARIQGSGDANVSYSQDRYIFHVKRTDGLTVLCVADDAFGRRIPFMFLEDIHQRFVRTYGRAILSAPAYTMNEEFSRILNQQMDHYSNDSNDSNADRLNRLKEEMSHVRTVMLDNIDKVLQRGDRLTMLVEKTNSLQGNTFRFRRQARRYRSTLWWANFKLMCALLVALMIVIYIMLAFICNGPLLISCRS